MVYATPLSLPIFASKVLDAIYIARAEISESIVVKAFGVIFSQVHSQPNNGINRIFVVVVITAQDDAIRLFVAFKVSVAIVNQPFRVHIEYPTPHFFCCFNVGIVTASFVAIEQKHAVMVLVVASKRLLSHPEIRWGYPIT